MRRLLLALLCCVLSQYALAVQYPKRIVSLTPNVTEMLYAIGAGKQVVGVLAGSDYPFAARKVTRVGRYDSINVEALAGLHPDLVLTWRNMTLPSTLAALAKLKIPVTVVGANTLSAVAYAMSELGGLTGHKKTAHRIVMQYKLQLFRLEQRYQRMTPKVRVFVQLTNNPLYTPTSRSLINQVIKLCGGTNIFGSVGGDAAEVAEEGVLKANPQVIIGLSPVDVSPWRYWPTLSAAKHKQLYVIPAALLAQPGPRLMQGALIMCADIAAARDAPAKQEKLALI